MSILLALAATAAVAFGISPSDYKVIGLEQYGAQDVMYSGYMPIDLEDNDEGAYFFWLAEMRGKTPENAGPVVVWLNGGKCSGVVVV